MLDSRVKQAAGSWIEAMSSIRSKPRFSWIALTALVGTSLITGTASASCTSMPAAGACAQVCCCERPESSPPISEASTPTTGRRSVSSRDGDVCPKVPGCVCRPQAPVAPEPKGQRAEQSRPDPSRAANAARLELGNVFRPFDDLVPATIGPPPESPLYLLNSRLLI